MNTNRLTALVTTVLAALFLALILVQENLEPYHFPLLLAIILCGLAALLLIDTFCLAPAGAAGDGGSIDWPAIAPGTALGIAYYLSLEWLGFYTASYCIFLVLIILYDKNAAISVRSLVTKVLITSAFMAVLYGLFAYALHVQAPQGVFI